MTRTATIDQSDHFQTNAVAQAAQAPGFWRDEADPDFLIFDGHQVEITAWEHGE